MGWSPLRAGDHGGPPWGWDHAAAGHAAPCGASPWDAPQVAPSRRSVCGYGSPGEWGKLGWREGERAVGAAGVPHCPLAFCPGELPSPLAVAE